MFTFSEKGVSLLLIYSKGPGLKHDRQLEVVTYNQALLIMHHYYHASATTLSIMKVSKVILSVIILSTMALSIMTLRIPIS